MNVKNIPKPNYKNILIIVIAFYMLQTNNILFGQITKNLSISFGLATNEIIGDNPGSLPFRQRENSNIYGGSFDGKQLGFGMRFVFSLDEEGIYTLPIGFDYIFMRAVERIPFDEFTETRFEHSINNPNITFGFNYALYTVDIAKGKLYAGIEGRISFLQDGQRTFTTTYELLDSVSINTLNSKNNVVRFGGKLHIGIDGELADPIYVNTSFGIGIFNLFGKDNKRGELFTPAKTTPFYEENLESTVYNMYLTFMIRYRL